MSLFKVNAKQNEKKLLLIFNGWGMDERVFQQLLPDNIDILIVSNYTQNNFTQLKEILPYYSKIKLLSWSMGVLQAQIFFTENSYFINKIDNSVAVNGTLMPIHNEYGISPDSFKEMADNFDAKEATGFYRRMCGLDFKKFLITRPERSAQSQKDELQFLLTINSMFRADDSIYKYAIISTKDVIIPTKNQCKFWDSSQTVMIKGSHFPFFKWNDLLECFKFGDEVSGGRAGDNK